MTVGGIDCDIHPAVPGIAALLPYMDPYWREQVMLRGTDGLDLSSYPTHAPDGCRPDWRTPEWRTPDRQNLGGQTSRGKPGVSLDDLRRYALDGFGSRIAICNVLYGAPAVFNRHFATILARATNDWLAAEWLDREPRLRGSIVVAPQDPEAAVAEIDRLASDRRFVQVLLLASGDSPLGHPSYWPIYRAAQRHRLTIGVHAGSAYRHPLTGNGWPSYHLEDVVARSHAFQGQLLNLVHEGVFTTFPDLTFVMIEAGFTWLPGFLWRANKTWRGVRMEVPWVDRPPADIIRERVRFTLQPGDPPPDAASMSRVLDQIGSDDMLLFSTDYPHWQFDGDDPFPPGFDAARRRRVLLDNPLATYPSLQPVMT